jgi:cysteine desulfurase/selenocysteine lyase
MTVNAAALTKSEQMPPAFDVERVRADFPILEENIHGNPLVFLDSAASAQKPRAVLNAMRYLYEHEYANVHRGIYYLSEVATNRFEAARTTVARFLNAKHDHEVIFTRNATEAINLVAASWGRAFLQPGDEIIVSEMEHHANIVPWQMLRDEKGLVLKVAPISDEGVLRMDSFEALLGPRTRLVAMTHMSNVLGTVTPARDIVARAHAVGAKVLLDGTQAATHNVIDVQDIGCDFYAITGHKLYGPTGIGALWAREEILDAMPPYMGGGEMIDKVTFEKSTFAPLPNKFEAGTPAIAEAIGFAAAIDYINDHGMAAIAAHEQDVLTYANQRLATVEGLRIIGTAPGKASVISMVADFAHAYDIAMVIDREGVAVRTGNHCAQPLMARLGVDSTVRASLGMYNRRQDIDALVKSLEKVRRIFG